MAWNTEPAIMQKPASRKETLMIRRAGTPMASMVSDASNSSSSVEGNSIVDSIVIGVGSGGTITGVGETVKAWTNDVRIVAVEPYESQALSSGLTGFHGIPDIGFGLVPGNYNSYVVDNIAAVTTADAVRAAQRVLRTDAIPASPSAGAALHAAAQLIANGKSRSALAVFSARQNIL